MKTASVFLKFKELKKLCSRPVWMYNIPSDTIFDLLPSLNIELNNPSYDRWKPTITTAVENFGNEFVINDNKGALKTLAETYHILHIDKYIDGVINIRQSDKGYFSVQPGVKRIIMLKHMMYHKVQIVCFDKKIPNADQYLTNMFNQKFKFVEDDIGPEIHHISWDSDLKKRLQKNPITVKITNYEVLLNDILFFKKTAYKANWKLVYK